MDIVFMILMFPIAVLLLVGYFASLLFKPKAQGSFTVKCYKNGELVKLQTYVNESYTVSPGDAYDIIVIEG